MAIDGARQRFLKRRRLLGALALPAINGIRLSHAAPPVTSVVASFSILHDMVASLCGTYATVHSLVGPNGDSHNYQPKPGDAKAIAAATLLVSNGLGFEPWLPRLIEVAGFKGGHVVASGGIEPMAMVGKANGAATLTDPHCWQDVACARR